MLSRANLLDRQPAARQNTAFFLLSYRTGSQTVLYGSIDVITIDDRCLMLDAWCLVLGLLSLPCCLLPV
jgi:hypothetical protein